MPGMVTRTLCALFITTAGISQAMAQTNCGGSPEEAYSELMEVLSITFADPSTVPPFGPSDPLHHTNNHMPTARIGDSYHSGLFFITTQLFGNDLANLAEQKGYANAIELFEKEGMSALGELVDFDNPVASQSSGGYCATTFAIRAGEHSGEYLVVVRNSDGMVVSQAIAATTEEAEELAAKMLEEADSGNVMLNPDGCGDLRVGGFC